MAFTDNFTGTAGDKVVARTGWSLLGSGWGPHGPEINASNQVRVPADNSDAGLIGQTTGDTDHYVQAVVYAAFAWGGTGNKNYLCARVTDRNEFFGVSYNTGEGVWELTDAGGFGRIGTYAASLTPGDVVRLECEGTTLRVKINGVTRITDTNSAKASNVHTGILLRGTPGGDPMIDTYESGPLTTDVTLTCDTANFAFTGNAALISPYDFSSIQRTLPASTDWVGVAHDGDLFFAVASGTTTAAKSTEGRVWSSATMPAALNYSDIASDGAGTLVAIAQGTATCYVSTDGGDNWTARTLPSSANWYRITHDGTNFCAIASFGSTAMATSPTGETWTARTLPSAEYWSDIAAYNGRIVIVSASPSDGSYGGTTAAAYSDNSGVSWTTATLSSSTIWSAVTGGPNGFVATSFGDDATSVSANGSSWTGGTLPAVGNWTEVINNGVFYITLARGTNDAAVSLTGLTWTAEELPATASWFGLAVNPEKRAVTLGDSSTTALTIVTFDEVETTGTVTTQYAPDGQSIRFVGVATDATGGLYTLTGSNGGVTVGPTAFTVTGEAFDFTVVELEPGDYAPTLTVSGPGGTVGVTGTSSFTINSVDGGGEVGGITLTAETANFAFTGNDATISASQTLTAETGAFAFTGNDANIYVTHILTAETGAFAFTGNDANFTVTHNLSADTANFSFTGNDASIFVTELLQAVTGNFSFVGNDADFTVGDVPVEETATLTTANVVSYFMMKKKYTN